MKFTVFYSWQSDLPNNTNRNLINEALEKALKDSTWQVKYKLELSLDRDVQGRPGASKITDTILEKISESDVFVADVSIVTGAKEAGQRPSPNPNVLIELGYAVGKLGWDKIVLISNDFYGGDNDLPFDIRQNIRIKYSLSSEDEKAPTRNKLVGQIKSAIDEILKHSKFSPKSPMPIIEIDWCAVSFEGALEPSKTMTIFRANAPIDYHEKVQERLKEAQKIDGSSDPSWHEKIERFKLQCGKFLEELSTPSNKMKAFLLDNYSKITPFTFSIANAGNIPANDLSLNLELPEDVYCITELPDSDSSLILPSPPTPRTLRIGDAFAGLANLNPVFSSSFKIHDLSRLKNRSCWIAKKDFQIRFRADRILHKHVICDHEEVLYFLAHPNSIPRKIEIKGSYFCAELPDWESFSLNLEIE